MRLRKVEDVTCSRALAVLRFELRVVVMPNRCYRRKQRGYKANPLVMPVFLQRVTLSSALLLSCFTVSALAQQNVGELFASDASVKGGVVLANAGTKVMSGSSIAAGAQTATLKLERGGSMHICPGTSLAITTSQNGRQLMFSMNTGNLEMDYPIGAASDNLLTPDFRLLLPGPGRLHIAVRVNPKGDTCVQSLPSNSSSVVVSEGMGDESYQVKPNEAIIFNAGRISGALPTRESCGCPAPPPMQVARATPPPVQPKPDPPKPDAPKSDPLPETHLVVDAPFIYRAADPVDLTENIAHLKMESKPMNFDPVVLPPAKGPPAASGQVNAGNQKPAQEKHGLFAKLGAFFAAIFH